MPPMQTLARLVAPLALLPVCAAGQAPAPVRSLEEFRQERVVAQQFDLSCGAAALATVLRYQHGEPVTEREVAIALVSREAYLQNPDILRARQGFSLLDMHRYVERLGYDGAALGGVAWDDLLRLAPAIVPLRLRGYNHFVVFRGAIGDNVLLADPAYGTRSLTRPRFLAAWIEYRDLGHVAFTVQRRDGLVPPNRLAVTARDFPLLR